MNEDMVEGKLRTEVLIAGALVLIGGALIAYFYVSSQGPRYQFATVTRGPISQEVLASGNVAAPSTIELQFQTPGILSYLPVQSGDKVTAGEVLASQDSSVLNAQLAQAQAAVQQAQANLASLQAGTRPEQIAVTQTAVANDTTALSQADQAVVNTIRSAYTQSDDAVHNKIDQFLDNPRTTNPQLTFTTSDSAAAATVLAERIAIENVLTTWMHDVSGLSSSIDLSAAVPETEHDLDLVNQLLSDSNEILNNAVSSSQVPSATIDGWITGIATARTNINAATTALTSAVIAQQSAAAALAKDQKNLALQQAGSTQQELDAQNAAVAQAKANALALSAQIAQKNIHAPVSGTITKIDGNVGESISSNTVVVTMIPDAKLEVDVNLSEDKVADVKVGQPVRIELDAFPDVSWQGTVTKVDPAQTVIGGAVYYKTTVAFETLDPRIKTGMTANVWIQTGNEANALIVPASAIVRNDTQTTISVEHGKSVVSVPVTVGLKSDSGMVQILSGLSEGDKVMTGQ